jgi:hypothetical protein
MSTATQTYRGIDGAEYWELIRPKRIEITRVEGPENLCGKVQVCTGWTDAATTLRLNSSTVLGRSDTHSFKIIFEDGLEYVGRYDLKNWKDEPADLARWVRKCMNWYATNPVDPTTGEKFLEPAQVDTARHILKRYDLGTVPCE